VGAAAGSRSNRPGPAAVGSRTAGSSPAPQSSLSTTTPRVP